MARDWYINGDTMVQVRGGAHLTSGLNVITNLGLAIDQVRVSPSFSRQPIHADGFGKVVAPEYRSKLMSARVSMTLVHFDPQVLDQCVRESQGGGVGAIPDPTAVGGQIEAEGVLAQAGTLMGGYKPRFASGNHYIGLTVKGTTEITRPWRFLYTMIDGTGPVYPLGNGFSAVPVTWLVVPYLEPPLVSGRYTSGFAGVTSYTPPSGGFEWSSSGVVLWDRGSD